MYKSFLTAFLSVLFVLTQAQNHNYRQYTTDDGLPTNYVYGVIEDEKGYIWIYTENGVCKFDGNSFKTLTTDHGLPHNDVHDMLMDDSGTIWLQSLGRTATYVDTERDSFVQKEEFKGEFNYFSIVEGRARYNRGSVYDTALHDFYNKQALEKINREESILTIKKKYKYQEKKHIFFFPQNILIAFRDSTYKGVTKEGMYFEGKQQYLKEYSFPEMARTSTVNYTKIFDINWSQPTSFYTNEKGIFLIGKNANPYQAYLFDSLQVDASPNHLTYNLVHKKKIVAGTDKCYMFFNKALELEKIFRPLNITDSYILLRPYFDSQGNLWIGTRDGGLFFINHKELQTNLIETNNPTDQVIEKLYWHNGQILAISDKMSIFSLTENELQPIFKSDKKVTYNGSTQRPNGDILFSGGIYAAFLKGTSNKLDSLTHYPDLNKLSINLDRGLLDLNNIISFKDISLNEELHTFFFTVQQGTFLYDLKTQQTKPLTKLLSDKIYTDTFNHKTYFTQKNKLYSYTNDSLQLELDSLYGVSCLYAKDAEHLWIGTNHKGLFEWDRNTRKLYLIDPKMTYVRSICKDGDRYLAASNKGLFEFHQTDSSYIIDYQYEKKDGFPSNEIFDVLADSNYIYAATMRGIAKIDKHYQPLSQDTLQRLKITAFTINGKAADWNQIPELDSNQNKLEIEYHLMDYASKGDIKYSYQLAPIQTDWVETKNRSILFSDLRSGNYTFQLKATDLYGKAYFLPKKITFCILKPFWQRWWFIALASLIFIALAYLYFKHLTNKQNQKIAEEKALNNKIADLQMQSLRAQMNPHFIFNSLGSIQYYIQTARTEEADDYLTMFARLMRKYLDSATERMINLETEIALLDEYTRLEMMRFEGQFTTSILVDPSIDIEAESLPSMMIQPYVENAINHGLQSRADREGELIIQFKKEKPSELVCIISDNGIGRKNAALNKRKDYQSRGMKNVQDRIETLRANEISDIQVQITDLSPDDKQYTGTKVSLTIKTIQDDTT